MSSFTEDMIKRGMRPGGRVLSFRAGPAGPKICLRLALSPGEEVLTIRRLRLSAGASMAIETLYMPRALLPELRREDLPSVSSHDPRPSPGPRRARCAVPVVALAVTAGVLLLPGRRERREVAEERTSGSAAGQA